MQRVGSGSSMTNSPATLATPPRRRRMTPRSPHEPHRVATPLELFFDLCFVVAVAQAGAALHHAVAEDHVGAGALGYALVVLRDLVGLDELHLVRLGLRQRRRPVPPGGLRPDRRRARSSRPASRGVRRRTTGRSSVAGYVVMRLGAGRALAARRASRSRRIARTALRYAVGITVAASSAGSRLLFRAGVHGCPASLVLARRRAGGPGLGRSARARRPGTRTTSPSATGCSR